MRTTLTLFLLLLFSGVASGQKVAFDVSRIKEYYLVLLKKGPDRSQDSAMVADLQMKHLAHLKSMYDTGNMYLVGPTDGDPELLGICVYAVESKEKAYQLAAGDPAVKAGRLSVEVLSWYTFPGSALPE